MHESTPITIDQMLLPLNDYPSDHVLSGLVVKAMNIMTSERIIDLSANNKGNGQSSKELLRTYEIRQERVNRELVQGVDELIESLSQIDIRLSLSTILTTNCLLSIWTNAETSALVGLLICDITDHDWEALK